MRLEYPMSYLEGDGDGVARRVDEEWLSSCYFFFPVLRFF